MRFRKIETMPKNGGASCEKDEVSETQACNTQQCGRMEYCVWNEWGSWSNCTATCGTGQQWRKRRLNLVSKPPKNDDTVLATQILDQVFGNVFRDMGTGSLLFTFFAGVVTALLALSISYRFLLDGSGISGFDSVPTDFEMGTRPLTGNAPVE
jgi:hypothetical protein